ncbi:MAG: division/cell wall cluster transcriptional repressor MraZ [Bacteroidia bacterium]
MLKLRGEYELKMDAKGRIMIPAALKKQLPKDSNDCFFINRGFEKYCVLYPSKEWELIEEEVNKLSDYIEKERNFKRYFLRGASMLEMDSTSRILIPKQHQEHAGLKDELMLIAMGNKIEIWSKEEYEKMLNNEPADFSALAEEVMGKKRKEAESDIK